MNNKLHEDSETSVNDLQDLAENRYIYIYHRK